MLKNRICTLTHPLAKATAFPDLHSLQLTDGWFLLSEHVLQAFEDR
jgi:hypothetical protein